MTGKNSKKSHCLKKKIFTVTQISKILLMQIMLTQKNFEIKASGECRRDLYVQSDTLLLADVFENFRNMLFKKYELDLARLYSAT